MSDTLSVSIDASAIPERMGGVGRYVANLVRVLGGRSDVQLAVVTRAGDRHRWLAENPAATVRDAAPGWRPARLLWEQVRLPSVLEGLGADVHHGPHYTMPRRSRLPVVVTVHDMTFVDHPEWHQRWKVAYFRGAIRAALRSAEVIVCVSQATADRLLAFGRPAGQVLVIPHGVDLDRFAPAGDDGSADRGVLAAAGVKAPYVAFVGTVEPRKGVPDLVRAFDRLAADHADLSLVIGGLAGWGEDAVTAAIATSPYRDRIVRLGYLDEGAVAPLLRQATAVAYPSLEEGFGLPVLEALACGAPTVTTNGSSMAEFASGAALLVDPGDPDALAAALSVLVKGDPEQSGRRLRGLEVAAAHTWEECAARHVNAYRLAAGLG